MGSIKLMQKQIDQWKDEDTEPMKSDDSVVGDNTAILDGTGKTFDVLFSDPPPAPHIHTHPSGNRKT